MRTEASPTGGSKTIALVSVSTVIGISYALVVVVAVHFLRPDLDPFSSPISRYAVGPYGAFMTSALLLWGLTSLLLTVGLHRSVTPSGWLWGGLLLLVVFAVGLVGAGFFPMDVPFPPENFSPTSFTAAGLIHVLSATVASVCFPFAALLLTKSFQQDERWRVFHRVAYVLAVANLAACVSFFIVSAVSIGLFGIAQKIFAVFALIWLLLTAMYLHATPHSLIR
jgi:MFS family permease